jgi:hypothetical protein
MSEQAESGMAMAKRWRLLGKPKDQGLPTGDAMRSTYCSCAAELERFLAGLKGELEILSALIGTTNLANIGALDGLRARIGDAQSAGKET